MLAPLIGGELVVLDARLDERGDAFGVTEEVIQLEEPPEQRRVLGAGDVASELEESHEPELVLLQMATRGLAGLGGADVVEQVLGEDARDACELVRLLERISNVLETCAP